MRKRIAVLFRTLADILTPKQATRMLELKDSDVIALKELRSLPEWDVFLTVLDRQSTLYGEAMLASQSIEKMWEMKGHILGLRMAGILVDEILHKEKEKAKNDERRRSNIRSDDHIKSALYGTPSWG